MLRLGKEHKQRMAREARRRYGIEWTPDQAERLLCGAVENVRKSMIAKGHREFIGMPQEKVLLLIREAMATQPDRW